MSAAFTVGTASPASWQLVVVDPTPLPDAAERIADSVSRFTGSAAQPSPSPTTQTDSPSGPAVETPAPSEGGTGANPCGFGVVTCASPDAAATPAAVQTPAEQDRSQLPSSTSLDELAAQTAQGARQVLEETYGSWLNTPSLSAGADNGLGLQALMLGLAAAGLTMVAIWQAIRLMVTRRGAVLAELVRGLMIAGVVTAAGIAVIDSALLAGDQIATAVLSRGFTDADALVTRMSETLLGTAVTERAPVLVMLFALMVLLLGIAQAAFLVLRQIAIPLLGALLPLAAVGQAGPRYTQSWLTKTLALVLAICVYKPLVVIVLCLGFAGPAPTEYSPMDATRGLVAILIAVAVFPISVRVFAPAARIAVERGMDLPSRTSRAVPVGAGTPGEVSAVSHASWMAGAHGSVPTVIGAQPDPRSGRGNAPPPVPGQAAGPVAATGTAVVPGVLAPRAATIRTDELIGQPLRGERHR